MGPYASLCVLVGLVGPNASLWVFVGPYASLRVPTGPNASLWVLVCLCGCL